MTDGSNWLAETRLSIGIVVDRMGWRGRRSHYPCPAKCEGGSALPVYSSGLGWECQRCHVRGDAADFVAYALHGDRVRNLTEEGRRVVREWFGVTRAIPVRERPPAESPPPPADLAAFWSSCPALDGAARAFLQSRGIDPDVVVARDLARVTPLPLLNPPPWWPAGRGRCWRLVARGYSTRGLANLHGRAVAPPPVGDDGKAMKKAYWAKGIPAAGVVMWNRVRPADATIVVIAEGITDWLTASVVDYQSPVAVYGATSGSFGAIRVPAGKIVVICPDSGDVIPKGQTMGAGDKYAAEIVAALPESPVHRMPLPKGVDLNDYVMRGGTVRELIAAALASEALPAPARMSHAVAA